MDKMTKLIGPGVKIANQLGIPTGNLILLAHIGIVEVIIIGIVVCVVAIFSIASCSIGMQCINSNGDYKAKNSGSYKFMIFALIMSIFLFFIGVAIIVARIVAKVYFPMI